MKHVRPNVSLRSATLALLCGSASLASPGCTFNGPNGRVDLFSALTGASGPASGGYQPTPQQPQQPQQPQPQYNNAVAGDASATGLAGADQALRAQGYQPLGPPATQPLGERQLVAYPIMAQPGACYVAIALGEGGARDVDMEVVGPSGQPLAEDREVDAHPTVPFCPQEPGVHFARITMYSGAGTVSFVAYQGPAGVMPNLAGIAWSGGRRPPNSAPAARPAPPPDPTTATRINAVRARLGASGYQLVRQPVGLLMNNGQVLPFPTTLAGGWCYSFATFGGPGVRDSDVFLDDASGQSVQSDTGTSADALIENICVPQTAQFQIRTRLYNGDGPVYFMAMARPNTQAGTSAQAQVTQTPIAIEPQGEQPGSEPANAPPSNSIDARFNRFARGISSLGYELLGQPVSQSLGTQAENTQAVQLQQGSCYAIAAIGDTTVQNLDLYLLDASNHEVDRDYATDPRPMVRVCPRTSGTFTVRMVMAAGQGAFRMGLFRWTSGTSGAGLSGLAFVRNAEVTRVLSAEGYQGDTSFEIFRGRIREGASMNRNVTLEQGACYAVVAVGGEGVSDLNLALQLGGRQVAADTELTAFPVVRYCAQQGGAHRAVIASAHGSGDFMFRVFRRNGGRAGN